MKDGPWLGSSTYDRICVEKCRVNACLFISLFALA